MLPPHVCSYSNCRSPSGSFQCFISAPPCLLLIMHPQIWLESWRSNRSYHSREESRAHKAFTHMQSEVDQSWIRGVEIIVKSINDAQQEAGVWTGHAGCDLSHQAALLWIADEESGSTLYLVWVYLSCLWSYIVPCSLLVVCLVWLVWLTPCVNVESLSMFPCSSWKWRDLFRADYNLTVGFHPSRCHPLSHVLYFSIRSRLAGSPCAQNSHVWVTLYIFILSYRKDLNRYLLVSCVFGTICWEFSFSSRRQEYIVQLNLCLNNIYHIGVHTVQSNSTFQRQQLEYFGVVKYCLLCWTSNFVLFFFFNSKMHFWKTLLFDGDVLPLPCSLWHPRAEYVLEQVYHIGVHIADSTCSKNIWNYWCGKVLGLFFLKLVAIYFYSKCIFEPYRSILSMAV